MTEVVRNSDASQNFDATQVAEEIAAGQQKQPHVNVEADYEASKEFSVSDIDRTAEGQKSAAEATAPQFELSQPQENTIEAEPTADPQNYRKMAKEISHTSAEGSNVTDELVAKAFQKGQAAQ